MGLFRVSNKITLKHHCLFGGVYELFISNVQRKPCKTHSPRKRRFYIFLSRYNRDITANKNRSLFFNTADEFIWSRAKTLSHNN